MKNLYKKGLLTDTLTLVIMGFIIAVVLVIMYMVISNINDGIQATSDDNIPQEQKQLYQDFTDEYVSTYDAVFAIIFFGLTLAAFIFLWFVNTVPIVFFFIWLGHLAILYLSAVLANAYATFQANTAVNAYASQFVFMPFVLSHYLEILIIITALYAVIFFSRTRGASF